VPAGFLELGETIVEGAARETLEEACAMVRVGRLFASVDVVDAGQVHLFFTGELIGGFGVGEETLEAALFAEDEIPWDEIAFRSGRFALRKYLEDAGCNNGVHLHELRRNRQSDTDPAVAYRYFALLAATLLPAAWRKVAADRGRPRDDGRHARRPRPDRLRTVATPPTSHNCGFRMPCQLGKSQRLVAIVGAQTCSAFTHESDAGPLRG
jgi:hypothetical protein